MNDLLSMNDRLLRVSHAARQLNRSPQTVRNYGAQGKLAMVRTADGLRLFSESDVLRLAAELAASPEPETAA